MPALVPFLPAIISGAASVGSALIGRSASKGASGSQMAAQDRADQITRDSVRDSGRVLSDNAGDANRVISDSVQSQLEMYRPYMEAGPNALGTLQDLVKSGGDLDQKFSFGREDFDNDPGLKFILENGQKALEQSAALKGGLFSTGTVKNLVNFKEGATNQYFNDAFNRALQSFNTNRTSSLARAQSLQDLVHVGMGGTAAAGGATQRGAETIGRNIFDTGRDLANIEMTGAKMRTGYADAKGDAEATGKIGSANAIAGGVTGASNAASKAISDWLATRKGKTPTPITINRDESGNTVENG